MKNKMFKLSTVLVALSILSGCATPTPNRITKVNETTYPSGITVAIYNDKIKKSLVISDARMSFGKSKRQAQFILNNKSDNILILKVRSEWTDKRGVMISTYPTIQTIKLLAHSGKRMVIDAPNFKAKDIILNIE